MVKATVYGSVYKTAAKCQVATLRRLFFLVRQLPRLARPNSRGQSLRCPSKNTHRGRAERLVAMVLLDHFQQPFELAVIQRVIDDGVGGPAGDGPRHVRIVDHPHDSIDQEITGLLGLADRTALLIARMASLTCLGVIFASSRSIRDCSRSWASRWAGGPADVVGRRFGARGNAMIHGPGSSMRMAGKFVRAFYDFMVMIKQTLGRRGGGLLFGGILCSAGGATREPVGGKEFSGSEPDWSDSLRSWRASASAQVRCAVARRSSQRRLGKRGILAAFASRQSRSLAAERRRPRPGSTPGSNCCGGGRSLHDVEHQAAMPLAPIGRGEQPLAVQLAHANRTVDGLSIRSAFARSDSPRLVSTWPGRPASCCHRNMKITPADSFFEIS